MSTALARRFKVDVSLTDSNYVPFKGINDLSPKISPNLVAADDYDTNGWTSHEKTQQSAVLTIKAFRKQDGAGAFDAGQEIVRGQQLGFGDNARVWGRWYDRNGAAEAFKARFLVTWEPSKTGVADLDEIQCVLTADGIVSPIANPATTAAAPVVISALQSGTGAGAIVVITGAYFTGTTGVTVGGTAAAEIDVLSDGTLVITLPAGATGSAPIIVTTPNGSSGSFAFTRA
jgi:hypothetical protein